MRTISGLLGGYLLWTVGRLAGNRLCHASGCIGGWEKLIFRIFCELLTKTYLESLVNSGFPECTVEMVIARLRALTHLSVFLLELSVFRRNGYCSAEGIDTVSAQRRSYSIAGRNGYCSA